MSIEMTLQRERSRRSVASSDAGTSARAAAQVRTEPSTVRIAIIATAMIFLCVFVVLPLVMVFAQAFSRGMTAYLAALAEPEALSAIR